MEIWGKNPVHKTGPSSTITICRDYPERTSLTPCRSITDPQRGRTVAIVHTMAQQGQQDPARERCQCGGHFMKNTGQKMPDTRTKIQNH